MKTDVDVMARHYNYKRELRQARDNYIMSLNGRPAQLEKTKENKGEKGKNCNRECCQTTGADWFNLSTRRWYCDNCAYLINEANMWDAVSLYGHPFLCVSPLDTAHLPS